MNSIPVFYLLTMASQLITDADTQRLRKDFEIAEAWSQQAWGVLRTVREFACNGGVLSTSEESRLESLESLQSKLTDELAERQ
jgi:hypothetical protein